MSDGSDQIFFRDPETFEVTKQISVRDGEIPVARINELEYIDGVIWANVWGTSLIARIDPESGLVIDWLDLTALTEQVRSSGERVDVLNGIAWNPETGTVYVTGKLWPTLFEIRLTDEN
jgi:glutaminyl-peptide cyclotransferase